MFCLTLSILNVKATEYPKLTVVNDVYSDEVFDDIEIEDKQTVTDSVYGDGTVTDSVYNPLVIDILVPTDLELNFSERQDGKYTTEFSLVKDYSGNLKIGLKSLSQSDKCSRTFIDVLPNKFNDWDAISAVDTIRYLAVGVEVANRDQWVSIDNSAVYAKTLQDAGGKPIMFGIATKENEINFNINIYMGKKFLRPEIIGYDMVFVFEPEMYLNDENNGVTE